MPFGKLGDDQKHTQMIWHRQLYWDLKSIPAVFPSRTCHVQSWFFDSQPIFLDLRNIELLVTCSLHPDPFSNSLATSVSLSSEALLGPGTPGPNGVLIEVIRKSTGLSFIFTEEYFFRVIISSRHIKVLCLFISTIKASFLFSDLL